MNKVPMLSCMELESGPVASHLGVSAQCMSTGVEWATR
jgi:hypothetical protein